MQNKDIVILYNVRSSSRSKLNRTRYRFEDPYKFAIASSHAFSCKRERVAYAFAFSVRSVARRLWCYITTAGCTCDMAVNGVAGWWERRKRSPATDRSSRQRALSCGALLLLDVDDGLELTLDDHFPHHRNLAS